MSKLVKIAVAESSAIIRCGLLAILKKIDVFHIQVIEIPVPGQLKNSLNRYQPDILIISHSFLGMFTLQQICKEASNPELKCIAMQHVVTGHNISGCFDEVISLNDSSRQISEKIMNTIKQPLDEEKHETLSPREIEVLICIIKGMATKEVADKLCLSTHTVTTHKRNISAKLNIRSKAGLVIYGIVNKLIELDDVKNIE